jgi:hypothetical protein
MSFCWIVITSTGKVISRTATVQRVTNLELQLLENKAKCDEYTAALAKCVGNGLAVQYDNGGELVIVPDDWDDPAFIEDFIEAFGRQINDPKNMKEANQDFIPDAYDNTYLNMELAPPPA